MYVSGLVRVLVALSETACAGSRRVPAVMAGDGTLYDYSSFDCAILPCIYSLFLFFWNVLFLVLLAR